MTQIKLCGLSRPCDIEWANDLHPDYIGFVFFPKSRRNVSRETAAALKGMLDASIKAVGVFVDAPVETVASLLDDGIIDIAQLHGHEDEAYIASLRRLTGKPIFKAFSVSCAEDIAAARSSSADMILLDSGSGGTGAAFDWELLKDIDRPYLLAGGLDPDNAGPAVALLHPYGVDVSSGIETDGLKDRKKMAAFTANIRKEDIS